MTARRIAIALVVVGFLASSCGENLGDTRTVRAAMNRTENAPHVLRYTDDTPGRRVVVTLRVDDSFRSSETLSLNGTPLIDVISSDDAAAVRLLAPDKWNPAKGTPLEPILGSGKWVVDPAGAPPVFFAETNPGESRGIAADVGKDELADAQNAFEYLRAVSAASNGIRLFDQNSITYRPSQDPFRNLIDADEKAGLKRYDTIPLVLPRTQDAQRGGTRIPDARVFRKLAIYLKNNRVIRVLERVDYEHHEEFLKAEKRGKPKFLLKVLSDLRKGVGPNPVRQRSMSIAVVSDGKPVKISLPKDAVQANFGNLLQSEELAKLPTAAELKPAASPAP